MPRSVDFCVDSPARVEQIHWAFSEQGYWQARLAAAGGFGRLDSLLVGPDGDVTVMIVHDLHPDGLPGPVAKFFPRDWQVVQDETWRPVGGGLVLGEVGIATHGAPGRGHGTAVLAPAQNGSRLKCTATVEFKVPLVGGKIESLIGRLLGPQFSMLQRFTADWIERHS
ncbi:MAG: DUF2505 domain-containing protein [Dietzia sp.]|nr:DUF2505 domain-containing protein [Dietzia sp.]